MGVSRIGGESIVSGISKYEITMTVLLLGPGLPAAQNDGYLQFIILEGWWFLFSSLRTSASSQTVCSREILTWSARKWASTLRQANQLAVVLTGKL
jgi:hypothetical protein